MWAVRLENVTKRYRMGGVQADSLGRVISNAPRQLAHRLKHLHDPQALGNGQRAERGKLALQDVSLEVAEGESFALIGSNGAGKSTALRLISRISPPTRGKIRVRGRVGALIEVSAGVHFELTGRENIWLYGSIIGIPKNEIRRRFDDIVEFSGLWDSLDTQVKYYSSGMQLRLGFSIASHLEPDVFVVDEALAVGDSAFQARCVSRMTKLGQQGTTLLFVSHHLPTVEALCPRGALLSNGTLVEEGEIKQLLVRYLSTVEDQQLGELRLSEGEGSTRVLGVSCHGTDGEEKAQFRQNETVEIRVRFQSDEPLERPHVTIGISDGRPGMLVQCSMLDDGNAPDHVGTEWECRLILPELPLRPRLYRIWCEVWAHDGLGELTDWLEIGAFRVVGEIADAPRAVYNSFNAGALAIPYQWDVRTLGTSAPAGSGSSPAES